jgi:hypothetical protein
VSPIGQGNHRCDSSPQTAGSGGRVRGTSGSSGRRTPAPSRLIHLRTKLNLGASCSFKTMPKNLSVFLREAADCLRDLALRAPDIANELRRLAEEVEQDAERAGRSGPPRGEDAA